MKEVTILAGRFSMSYRQKPPGGSGEKYLTLSELDRTRRSSLAGKTRNLFGAADALPNDRARVFHVGP
jgi:hypothetical protein